MRKKSKRISGWDSEAWRTPTLHPPGGFKKIKWLVAFLSLPNKYAALEGGQISPLPAPPPLVLHPKAASPPGMPPSRREEGSRCRPTSLCRCSRPWRPPWLPSQGRRRHLWLPLGETRQDEVVTLSKDDPFRPLHQPPNFNPLSPALPRPKHFLAGQRNQKGP